MVRPAQARPARRTVAPRGTVFRLHLSRPPRWAELCPPNPHADPQHLCRWLFGSAQRGQSEAIRVAPIPYDRCPHEEVRTQDDLARTQDGDSHLHTKGRGLRRNQPCGTWTSASSPVRAWLSVRTRLELRDDAVLGPAPPPSRLGSGAPACRPLRPAFHSPSAQGALGTCSLGSRPWRTRPQRPTHR